MTTFLSRCIPGWQGIPHYCLLLFYWMSLFFCTSGRFSYEIKCIFIALHFIVVFFWHFFLFVLSPNYMVRLNWVIDLSWRPRFLFTKWNQPTWPSTVRQCQAQRNESTPSHVRGTSKSWFIRHPCRICQLILHNQTLIAALPHPFLSVLKPEMHT
jgi:hypothetical protein